MSERDFDRGAGRQARDARWPPDPPGRSGWSEEPGASVFDRGGDDPYGATRPAPEPWPDPAPGWADDQSTQQFPGRDPYPPAGPGADPYGWAGPHGGQVHVAEPAAPAGPATAWQPQAPAPPATAPAPAGPGYEPWPGEPGPGGPRRRDRRRARDERRGARGGEPGGGGPGFPFGLGALLGVAGLAGVLLALMVLPWFTVGGQDVELSDIRTAYEGDGPPAGEQEEEPSPDGETGPSLPDDVTSPGEVGDAVVEGVQDAAGDAAASAIDSGKARYLELYVERLWPVVAIGTGLAVLFSTILAPRSFALSLLLGFRRLAGLVTVLAAGAHGAALWILFTGDGAPEPASGVWIGVAGFAGVLAGCIVGPKG